jgi:UDP-N-acetyl-D-mannosaminuronic acid dehydrogenase
MPGRLEERVATSDKLVAGLHPATPELIARLYSRIVVRGTLHLTSSLTAEVVKTLENAYRDVRIAYAAEIVRWCDDHDIDFFALRDRVNEEIAQTDASSSDPLAVPTGGLLVPTVGVGGHCLPKDGVLLWWRRLEARDAAASRSLILASREVNDASPAATIALAERRLGPIGAGRTVALLGVAYRGDSEDTRNSPTLALAERLRARGCEVRLHDPHVRPGDQNLVRRGFDTAFTRDFASAVRDADLLFVCAPHRAYVDGRDAVRAAARRLKGVVDACNLWPREDPAGPGVPACGIGRGRTPPTREQVDFVAAGFRAVERGVAREVAQTAAFLNERYAKTAFERIDFATVRRLAATCGTGCAIVEDLPPEPIAPLRGFLPRLVALASS